MGKSFTPGRIKPLGLSSDGSSGDESRRSRLDGNTRDPSEEELAIMDEMITKLSSVSLS